MHASLEHLFVAAVVAVLATALAFGSPAGAHYETAQRYKHSAVLGACVQTKVGHGEVTGGIVAQARTWSRTYNVNCDNTLNRIAGQIYARVRPTLVAPSGLEVECGFTLSGWNTTTTNNYGVSMTATPSGWANYFCSALPGWRIASVSDGQMVVWVSTSISVSLAAGTNTYGSAHPL